MSKDLSDHFASGRGSYKQALLSENFSAVLQNSGIARRSPPASGTKPPVRLGLALCHSCVRSNLS